MSVLVKSTYLYIFTTTITYIIYGWWTFGVLGVEYFTGPDDLVRIGKALSILIIGGYGLEWSCMLLAGLFSSKVFGKPLDLTVDERDRQIVHKSIFASHFVLVAGLCFSAFGMALGLEAFWVFNAILLAYVLSVVAELGSKLVLCRADT